MTSLAQGITAFAGGGFRSAPFASQTSKFTAEFDATPTNTNDAGVGLADNPFLGFAGTSTFVRFNTAGKIDVRKGADFAAAAPISYLSGLTYHFREDVDVVNAMYSVYVKLPGKASNPFITVAKDFAFRTTANNVFNLDNVVVEVHSAQGKLNVKNLVVTALAPQIPNPNCTIVIPPNPLTATGLATPYLLKATNPDDGPCHQANADQSAFVQAAIIDTDTGQISIYAPLVIDIGTHPAVAPVKPTLPAHHVVALWFGYNGDKLKQDEAVWGTLRDNNCVNGFANTLFGQYSYCNAVDFFAAANTAINKHQLVVPPLGVGADGQVCPTVRSFAVVDQDQSDNIPTTYLMTTGGLFAQNTAANRAAMPTAKAFGNPSDNRLVDALLDPALNCTPWTVPDITDPGAKGAALPLNELQAAMFQPAPVALIPLNDPMALVNDDPSLGKVNAYRAGVNQPAAANTTAASGLLYCQSFRQIHPTKLKLDKALLAARPSPFPDLANSLFTFMVQRANASYIILGCQDLLNLPDRITPVTDANGVVTDAVIN